MASRSSQLIIVLAAILLAVIAGSGLVLWFLNSNQDPATLDSNLDQAAVGENAPVDSTVPQPTTTGAAFNTNVLRSSRYTTLDQQLVTDGSLPVQPPAAVGKANPFL